MKYNDQFNTIVQLDNSERNKRWKSVLGRAVFGKRTSLFIIIINTCRLIKQKNDLNLD